jgi:hypothetical protein
MTIMVKKYGQITQVYVDNKLTYVSGNTVKAEVKNLNKLLLELNLLDIMVEEG